MGTTLTMALVMGQTMYVAHVGDTRCYLLRGGELRCLTTDHTMAHRLEEASHERLEPGSQLHHILWNALGATEDLPQPEITKLSLEPGDVLLLCSDGLTKHVPDLEITRLLGAKTATGARCQRLVELANAGGGTDNVTVVIADLGASGRAAPPTA
jgi:serine/threonine protein phosphatase PrpC